ncbi:MAG: AEC family transporter [Kiritimatiellia bacterium]
MQIIFTSILPICFIIALGTILIAKDFLPKSFFLQLNRLGFYILLPALISYKIATADAHSIAPGLHIGCLLCVCSLIISFIAWAWSELSHQPNASARSLMQAAMRGNLAYSGLPIILFTFGADSEMAELAVIAFIPAIPFYNLLAVIILTPPEGSSLKTRLKKTITGTLSNPLIIACAVGLAVMLTELNIPASVLRAVKTLGQAALPCAILSLGAGLSFDTMRLRLKPAIAASFLKLLVMPLIGYFIARVSGIDNKDILLISLIYLASPTAVTSYVMAEQMKADKELAASAVTLSTLFAMPVLAFVLLVFG